MTDIDAKVVIGLSAAEALVLFEWLANHDGRLPSDDPAEQRVLWRVEAMLERALVEPLSRDYEALVAAARARIREGHA
jgi:hypothetical protein